MKLSDDDLAERINQICTRPGGLIELDPRDARLIACSVLANTIIATKWEIIEALTALGTTINMTIAEGPRLPKVRRN